MDLSMENWEIGHPVWYLAVSPDGTRVAIGYERSLAMYDMEKRQRIFDIQAHPSSMTSMAFSPNGDLVASTSLYPEVRLWNPVTGHALFNPLEGHTEWVMCVTFSHDSRVAISGGDDRTIRLWDTSTGLEAPNSPIMSKHKVYSLSASPDGTKLVAACAYGLIEVYSLSTITWQRTHTLTEEVKHAPASIALFSPDSHHIFALGGSPFLVWETLAGSRIDLNFENGPEPPIPSFIFSHDGRHLAASSNKTIDIWDKSTGGLYRRFSHGYQEDGCKIAYLPDGKGLLSGSRHEHAIKLWKISSDGEQIKSLEKEPESIEITTLADVLSSLRARRCQDMTPQLDLTTPGEYPISSGGFGDIYKCKLRNGLEVAVKTVRLYIGSRSDNHESKHLKHAAQELYAWSKCKHANIQPLLGFAMFRGSIGMIAEWESNGSMPEYLERQPGVDRCVIIIQIVEGLSYLHASGVVHGDMKGANVLISKDGVPRLADFGNAKLQEYTLKFTKSSTKESLSSRWAAPELFEGVACNFKTDVYALGMTILEAITGDVPWSGQSERFVLFAVTVSKQYPERPEAHIPTYSEHGDALWSLLQCCWDSDPEKRPNADQAKITMKGITRQGLRSADVEMDG